MPGTRKARQEQAAPPKQNERYLFNIHGWSIEIPTGMEDITSKATIINAFEPLGPWTKAVDTMKNNGQNPWRQSLSLTERETDPNEEPGIQKYLLVGFATRDHDKSHLHFHESKPKQTPVGIEANPKTIVQCNDLPLMMVTPIQDSEPTKVDLYVLLHPKQGLCTPYQIGQDRCFYLPMFRNAETVKKNRGPAWNSLVMQQAVRPSEAALSKKQLAYKRARNTTKVVLEPKLSLQNEILSLVECFASSGEMWHLQEIQNVLEQADEDLMLIPMAENTAMRKFVDNDEDFEVENEESIGDAALMVMELHSLWPDLTGMSATDLATLKVQLQRQNLVVEYRLLRPFLAEACFQLQQLRNEDDKNKDNVAKDALATVQRIIGTSESAAPIVTASDEALLLPAITTSLKNMLKAARAFDKGLKDSTGDQTMTGTLQDVWEKYANALDTDAAKKSWMEAARYMISAFKHKQRGLDDMVSDLVELLEKMQQASESG